MSRSNPTTTNPATRFFKWSGSKGKLVYWNKDKQQEVEQKIPFSFLVLDQLATVSGYSDKDKSQYWSNEVRNVANDELVVRTSSGIRQAGLYKDLADVRANGAKYAKSVYIAFKDGGEYVMGNFKVTGAALTSWIEICNKYKVENGGIRLTGSTEGKKGTTVYQIPTFEYFHSTDDENLVAIKLDQELQEYLSKYLTPAKIDKDAWTSDSEDDLADFQSQLAKGLEADGIDMDELPPGF